MKNNQFRTLIFVFVLFILTFSAVSAQEPGEILPNTFDSYDSNDFGIIGPEKIMVWDAPLYYADNSDLVKYWEVRVNGGDLGSQTMRFYTTPFSLYWDRALFLNSEDGTEERILAPIGRYRATISAFDKNDDLRAQRDVEIVIPDPDKAWYENYPEVYWPQTGSDPRLILIAGLGLGIVLLLGVIILHRRKKNKDTDAQ